MMPNILSLVLSPYGERKDKMKENFIHSITENNTLKNYSIWISIEEKYWVNIVYDNKKIIARYESWKGNHIGQWRDGVFMKFKNEKKISEEKCSFNQFLQEIDISMDDVNILWKNVLSENSFDKVSCKKIEINSEYGYSWKFQKETKTDHYELYVDTDKSGKNYD